MSVICQDAREAEAKAEAERVGKVIGAETVTVETQIIGVVVWGEEMSEKERVCAIVGGVAVTDTETVAEKRGAEISEKERVGAIVKGVVVTNTETVPEKRGATVKEITTITEKEDATIMVEGQTEDLIEELEAERGEVDKGETRDETEYSDSDKDYSDSDFMPYIASEAEQEDEDVSHYEIESYGEGSKQGDYNVGGNIVVDETERTEDESEDESEENREDEERFKRHEDSPQRVGGRSRRSQAPAEVYCGPDCALDDIQSEYCDSDVLESLKADSDAENDRSIQKGAEYSEQMYNESPMLELGMQFSSAVEFRQQLRNYATMSGYDLKFTKNEGTRVVACCKADRCKFKVYAGWNQDKSRFVIKALKPKNKCYRNDKTKPSWLATKYLKWFRSEPNWNMISFMKAIFRDYNLIVEKSKAYRVRRMTLDEIEGKHVAQYANLWNYAYIEGEESRDLSLCEVRNYRRN